MTYIPSFVSPDTMNDIESCRSETSQAANERAGPNSFARI